MDRIVSSAEHVADMVADPQRAGPAVMALIAAYVLLWWVYGVIALNVWIEDLFFFFVSTMAAIVGLFVTHARMRRTAS